MPTEIISGFRKSKLPTTIEQPVQADIVKPPTRLLAPSSLLARNAVLNFVTEGWTFVVLVLAMPKLVAYWGETSFGLFSLAWVVIGYLSFLDIGVNRAATKFISEHLADRDDDAVRGLVRTSFLANLTFGLAGAVFVLLASPYLVHSVFKISGALQREARLVFFAVALAVPMLLVQGIFRAVLSSYQRFGWINSVNAVTMTAQWGSAIWLAWRGHGVAVVVLATVITRLLGTLAYGTLLYRLLPGIRLWGAGGLSGLAKLLKFGTWVSISQVISPLLVYLDRILIASFVSLGAVTLYTVPYEVMTRLRIIPASLATTLYPAFSERGIEGQQHQLQSLYERSVRYLLLITLPVITFLVVLGPDLLSVWMGNSFAKQTSLVLQLLGLGVLLNCLATIPYNALQALGRPDLTGKLHLLELPPYLVLCLFLIPHWGIIGAALANSIRISIDAVLLFWAARKYCGCLIGPFWRTAIPRITGLNLLLGAALLGIRPLLLPTPWERLGAGAFVLALYFFIVWHAAIDKGDKPRLNHALRMLAGQQAS
jgi:O-antigen/teichoic acid export membrane protein